MNIIRRWWLRKKSSMRKGGNVGQKRPIVQQRTPDRPNPRPCSLSALPPPGRLTEINPHRRRRHYREMDIRGPPRDTRAASAGRFGDGRLAPLMALRRSILDAGDGR